MRYTNVRKFGRPRHLIDVRATPPLLPSGKNREFRRPGFTPPPSRDPYGVSVRARKSVSGVRPSAASETKKFTTIPAVSSSRPVGSVAIRSNRDFRIDKIGKRSRRISSGRPRVPVPFRSRSKTVQKMGRVTVSRPVPFATERRAPVTRAVAPPNRRKTMRRVRNTC